MGGSTDRRRLLLEGESLLAIHRATPLPPTELVLAVKVPYTHLQVATDCRGVEMRGREQTHCEMGNTSQEEGNILQIHRITMSLSEVMYTACSSADPLLGSQGW